MQPETITLSRYKIKFEGDEAVVTGIAEEIEDKCIGLGYSFQWLEDFDQVVQPPPTKVGSPEFRARISNSLKGRVFSDETKAKMSAAKKGKRHSEEHIARLKANHVGMKDKTHSEETKAKISLALKGKPKSEDHKHAIFEAKRQVL